MKISAKTDYACRALLELALHWPSEAPLHVNDIAARQKIPMKFLPHILIALKQFGYVQSARGQKGGYVLLKAPQAIRLRQVIENFEKEPFARRMSKKSGKEDVFENIWGQIDRTLVELMDKIDFEEICNRQRNHQDVPMYTI